MAPPDYLLTLLLSLSQARSEVPLLAQCSSPHHQAALSLHTVHQCSLVTEVVKLELPSEGNIIQVWLLLTVHRTLSMELFNIYFTRK